MRPLVPCALILAVPLTLAAQPQPQGGTRPKSASARASALSQNSIQVGWTPVLNAKEYWVFRAVDPNGPFAPVGKVDATSTSFMDQGLVPGTVFYYRIDVIGRAAPVANGPKAVPPLAALKTNAGTLPSVAPRNVRCTSPMTASGCTLTWDPVPGATGYATWTRKLVPGGCFYRDRKQLFQASVVFTKANSRDCPDSYQIAATFFMQDFPAPGAKFMVEGPRATFP